MRDDVAQLLRSLPERERLVITMTFGLEGREERTLAEVAEALGLSDVRVGQLRDRALRRLRCAAG